MEAPNRIWVSSGYCAQGWSSAARQKDAVPPQVGYIRADLVEKLIGYAVHSPLCREQPNLGPSLTNCTCGLTEKIREIRGE